MSKSLILLALFKEQLTNLVGSLEKQRFLIAISGGVDSVVLAFLSKQLELDFGLCHVNYHLRAEDSILDENLVHSLAKQWGKSYHTIDANLSKYDGNIQIEARNIRYSFFKTVLKQHSYDYVLTAHHMDDVAETFLFNIGRGTGLDGMLSIPEINGRIIRPLLVFSKDEIKKYASINDIEYREDDSNASDKYARNYLRHHAIPALKKQNSNFLNGLKKSIEHIKAKEHYAKLALNKILVEGTVEFKQERAVVNAEIFKNSKFPAEIAYHWLSSIGFTGGQVSDFFSKAEWQNSAKLVAGDWQVIYDRGKFILTKKKLNKVIRINFHPKIIRKIQFNKTDFEFKFLDSLPETTENSGSLVYLNADEIDSLTIRNWNDGDRFQPKGMKGQSKTLKKYFTDEKFSLDKKANTPLLVAKNKIIWIVGHRTDHRFNVTNQVKSILQVSIKVKD